jgi:alpha-ribazole phosphatase
MSPYRLHLLRHGAPETPGLLMGWADGKPTPAGIAACLEQTSGEDIAAVVSSNLLRALAPAEAISERLALPPVVDPRWRELNFGDWDGLAASQIDPPALARFWNDPDADPPPRGEKWSALVARVAAAIAALEPRSTLVVTHAGAMRAALAHLCGFGLAGLWAVDLPYGALLSLDVWPGEVPSGRIVGLRT